MQRLVLFLILSFFVSGCTLFSAKKPEKELYVIHIHGDWCMTCASVDPVVHSLQDYFQKKRGVQYLVFDETSPEAVKKSGELAARFGLGELFEYQRHTGEVLFVDKDTKDVLAVFAGVGDKELYIDTTESLLQGKEVKSFDKLPKKYELSKPTVNEIKQAKLYVINVHHDKCGTCSITAPVFEQVAAQYKNNKDVSFFTFDLSTQRTIDETRDLATKLGIKDIYDKYKHTGEVLFVDAATKKIKQSIVAERSVVKYHKIIDMILQQT